MGESEDFNKDNPKVGGSILPTLLPFVLNCHLRFSMRFPLDASGSYTLGTMNDFLLAASRGKGVLEGTLPFSTGWHEPSPSLY
jgi:hypothetical protein